MRKRKVISLKFISLLLAVCCGTLLPRAAAVAEADASDERFVGVWAGTWDGAGSGKIEVTVAKDGSGKLTGKVAATTEGGDYTAELKTLAFAGNKLTAKYDFPLDDQAEVLLEAAIEGATLKGTWSLRPKGQDTEVAGGPWTATKK
jgi:hypothetical protein